MNTGTNTQSELHPKIPGILKRLDIFFPGQVDSEAFENFLSQRTNEEIEALDTVLMDMEGKIFDPKQIISDDLQKIIYNYLPLNTKLPEELPFIDPVKLQETVGEIINSPLGNLLKLSDEKVGKIIKSTGHDYSGHGIDVDTMTSAEIGKRIKEVLTNFAQKNMDEVQRICDRLFQEGKRRKII